MYNSITEGSTVQLLKLTWLIHYLGFYLSCSMVNATNIIIYSSKTCSCSKLCTSLELALVKWDVLTRTKCELIIIIKSIFVFKFDYFKISLISPECSLFISVSFCHDICYRFEVHWTNAVLFYKINYIYI
jgi:hypothetical protein